MKIDSISKPRRNLGLLNTNTIYLPEYENLWQLVSEMALMILIQPWLQAKQKLKRAIGNKKIGRLSRKKH